MAERNYTKGESEIQQAVFNKFRFSDDDLQIFPDGIMALTESGTIKLLKILPSKAKTALDMYEALKAIIARRMECHETEAAYIPSEIELAYKALAKTEGKE